MAKLRAPRGLGSVFCRVWHDTLEELRESGEWKPYKRALLDEYVFALKAAAESRDGKPVEWDRHVRRSMTLADRLGLGGEPAPRSRGRSDSSRSDEGDTGTSEVSAFDELDAESGDVVPLRQAR